MKKAASGLPKREKSRLVPDRPSSAAPVLIVDDSDSDIFFLLRAFAGSGVKNPVQVVRSGKEALRYLQREGKYSDSDKFPFPGIVILDLHMPFPDGFEILRWKQNQPDLKEVLFVALSNLGNTESIRKAYQSGATTFLSKPLEAEDIRNLIHSFEEHWLLRDSKMQNHGKLD